LPRKTISIDLSSTADPQIPEGFSHPFSIADRRPKVKPNLQIWLTCFVSAFDGGERERCQVAISPVLARQGLNGDFANRGSAGA
jgi:hypothetical protein